MSGDRYPFYALNDTTIALEPIVLYVVRVAHIKKCYSIQEQKEDDGSDIEEFIHAGVLGFSNAAMVACHLLGETFDRDGVSKAMVRHRAHELWARGYLLHRDKVPTSAAVEAEIKRLPTVQWNRIYNGLGLSDLVHEIPRRILFRTPSGL
jgi:hypothetical protein